MSLVAGSRLGPYEVLASIGAGGMGEVYRARDTTLNRDIALKILPESFAADADRVARFKREAQVLAALNHPNIAAIYGFEQSASGDSQMALVMELVEGDDLSVRIAQGPLSVTDTLGIARQILDALEAAHEAGIVHRDLKPANIKIRHDGTVKVLDFGLAKALIPGSEDPGLQQEGGRGFSPGLANSPTLTARATQMGMILGTAAYMSPEQARGRAVDKRTDVWAFGCVLYEMLTGAKAFDGDDATEIISSVVKSEPDLNALPASVPAHVRAIVARCLTKDRKARIPDVSVVRYMLDGVIPAGGPARADESPVASRRYGWAWPAATAVLLLTTMAAGVAWYRARSVEPVDARFMIAPPDGTTFTSGPFSGATVPAISPDGRSVAFTAQDAAGKRLLYLRHLGSLVAQPLSGTEGAAFPFWSPDSSYLGYAITGKLMKVAATGGPPQTLCTLNPGITSRGGSWNRDNVIIFNNGPAPLYRVPATGGATCEVMGKLPEGQTGREFPSFLPDGKHFLFHATGATEQSGLLVGSLDSDETTRLMASDTGAIYDAESRQILFVRENTLLRQTFDPRTVALSGDPIPVAEKVEAAAQLGVVAFSISETGTLAYGIGQAAGSGLRLTWVDRQGKAVGTLGQPAAYRGVSLSPDGKTVAVHRHDGEGGDIWLIDVGRNALSRFTFDPTQENSSPVWSPAGDRIAYQSMRNGRPGINVKSLSGADTEERVFETTTSRMAVPTSWIGRTLVIGLAEAKTASDIWTVLLAAPPKAAPKVQTPASEFSAQLSPDGQWLAYQSNESTRSEIYVQSATTSARKWTISTGGGNAPRWRGDSRELYFTGTGRLWAVDIVAKGVELVPGVPRPLFNYPGIANASHPTYFTSYDVARDGQRFLVTRRDVDNETDPGTAPIVVVLNWRKGLGK